MSITISPTVSRKWQNTAMDILVQGPASSAGRDSSSLTLRVTRLCLELGINGLAPNCSFSYVSTAAGVYALKQVTNLGTYQYYFGSAVNHYNRLTDSTASAERPRLSLSHQEARFINLKLIVRQMLCMQ